MRYAQIREMDVSNGYGIGISLFVQGCHFHCSGCFNQETWDFDGGKKWTTETHNKILELVNKEYIKRFSILGGEPLEPRNINPLIKLIDDIKKIKPDIQIWIYTGYTIEKLDDIMSGEGGEFGIGLKLLLNRIDYLVDGQFDYSKQDILHKTVKFAGSTNQRIIDMKTRKD